jgi:hypothetical protein
LLYVALFLPILMFAWTRAVVRNISSIDQTIVSRRKIIALSYGVVFGRVIYGHLSILKVTSYLARPLIFVRAGQVKLEEPLTW